MTQTAKDTKKTAQTGDTNGVRASETTDGLLEGFEWAGGRNVQWQMQGDYLLIAIDTTKTYGESASGKSSITASTGGFTPIGNSGISLNVNANVMKKAGKSKK